MNPNGKTRRTPVVLALSTALVLASALAGCGAAQTPEDPGVRLTVVAPASAEVGAAVPLVIEVAPARGWTLTDGYPIRVELTAPQTATLEPATTGPSGAAFATDIRFTAAGDGRIDGQVRASVCEATRCIAVTETVSHVVRVR